MICMNCQKDLTKCTCPDLSEKIAKLEKCPNIIISPYYLQAAKEQGERNKRQDPGSGGQAAFDA